MISFASLLLRIFALNLFSVTLCLCAFGLRFSPITTPTHVLVISLDGARPDGILLADTPNIQALAERGAASWEASTISPSVTLPAHTSMLTGLSLEQHGVDFNGTQFGCPPLEPPTFLTLAEEAGYQTALVTGKEKFCLYNQSEGLDYTFARNGDQGVADRAIELLEGEYEVIFAHFPNPDYFGHRNGWMSDIYLHELSNTDAQVGRVLDKLDELGLTGDTLVILTADHGGHDTTHGTEMPEDMLIPWIIAGPGVEPGVVLDEIVVYDTAPTVLWALGLPLPEGLSGEPVYAAFGLSADETA